MAILLFMEKTLQSYTQLLDWYRACGVDVLMTDVPRNHYLEDTSLKFSMKSLTEHLREERVQTGMSTHEMQPVASAQASILPNIKKESLPVKMVRAISAAPVLDGDHPALSCETLDQLRDAMENAKGCDLIKAATHTVFAGGDSRARIMIIGEAPGADEDRVGQPFVGQSGQLLNAILATIGLDRSAVYISNIIPWRPPGNRPPTTIEMNYCVPFIKKHIELVAPQILILLGGVAVKTLLGKNDGILKLRGQIFDYTMDSGATIAALPTFHPSYIMRSPSQKAHVWKDMLVLKNWLLKNSAQT